MDEETWILSKLISAEAEREKRARRRYSPSRITVTLSERDVAQVLQAVAVVECWKIGRDSTSNYTAVGLARWDRTPEGWPVPSRKLMEEIKKLL